MTAKNGISQEGLKILACVTMLIDHVGAVFFPQYIQLRVIGRLAFPIFCFLLAEGVAHTRNPVKYGIRLAIGMLLSEIPFDLLLFGGITLEHSSVMVTLLLGFLMAMWMRKMPKLKIVAMLVCVLAAELLGTDYGGMGVVLIALFVISREWKDRIVLQFLGCAAICWLIGGYGWQVGPVYVPIEIVGVLSMIPIAFYHGRKATRSKVIQWGFYLFYPVHLTVLLLIFYGMYM